MNDERRSFATEVRLASDTGILSGLGVVYNQWSSDLGGFIEIVKPGAGAKSMSVNDIFSTYNHDDNMILGRSSAGTLKLDISNEGISYQANLPATSFADDLKVSIGRGDVRGSSFRFRVTEDNWGVKDGVEYREIIDFDLFELGPVTNPAYPQTTAGVRALIKLGIDYEALTRAILKTQTDHAEQRDLDLITSAIEVLSAHLPSPQVDLSEDVTDGLVDQVYDALRLRLKML